MAFIPSLYKHLVKHYIIKTPFIRQIKFRLFFQKGLGTSRCWMKQKESWLPQRIVQLMSLVVTQVTTEHEDLVEIHFDIKNIYNFILDKKINAH